MVSDIPDWWGSSEPYRICDWVEGLKSLPDVVIDCVVTSPPYWSLRDYGVDGQVGLEETPKAYVERLCDGFDEVKRVLKDTGTVWVNIGDTYSGSGGAGGDWNVGKRALEPKWRQPKQTHTQFGKEVNLLSQSLTHKQEGYANKCLIMTPFRFAVEMVDRGWILRNTIIWHKESCTPSSVHDRFTVNFEYVFFFVKNKKYYLEQQFEPFKTADLGIPSYRKSGKSDSRAKKDETGMAKPAFGDDGFWRPSGPGRNRRCVWTVNPSQFADSHFAVFPSSLIETPIRAGCPRYVCNECGKPREKLYDIKHPIERENVRNKRPREDMGAVMQEVPEKGWQTERTFVGYSDCGCGAGFSPGIVLDPFLGSGTTVATAMNLGRTGLGFELNPDYEQFIKDRIKYRNREKKSRPHVRKAKTDKKQMKLEEL